MTSLADDDREYMDFCLGFCGSILQSRPNHLEALQMAATCLTELGFYADGLKADLRLAALNPDDPLVLYNLACSHSLNENLDQAHDALADAIAHGYSDHLHMQNDRDLVLLRSDPRFKKLLKMALKTAKTV